MNKKSHKAIAIVGVGAVMPDAKNTMEFWNNIKNGKYSISDVRPERWGVDKYFDPDPKAPDKSYTKIGGWVHDFDWEPLKWKLPIPPKVSDLMDLTQKWAIIAAREALMDFGYPERPLNKESTAVILGNAMGGDQHLYTATRILFPEYAEELEKAPSFSTLSADLRKKIIEEMRAGVGNHFSPITEDTMPGELGNIIAGRIAALFDLKGPNYIADAACASAMAAINAAIEGLEEYDYDAVITGGIDANMAASTFVKFCKIGALSATGTRPYADGADGFVMGEGAAVFMLKRLEDAERDGDKIYAVFRGIGGSSDGKGKGITAPNPIGQRLAVQRGWENAGLSPATASMIEGHGTSTRVGDAAELQSLVDVFGEFGLKNKSIALGSVKSNIGHLKGAAGAAGILKAAMSLHEKIIPPSLNFNKPNPNIDFEKIPFYVNTELRPWELNGNEVRRVGVSAFGFGGTNFHSVLEEYIPGRIQHELEKEEKTTVSTGSGFSVSTSASAQKPLRGALLIGGQSEDEVLNRLLSVRNEAKAGKEPAIELPDEKDLQAPIRLAIDFGDASDLSDKADRAIKALESKQAARWRALRSSGIFLGSGPPAKVAFLFPGQGSQYVNMLKTLKENQHLVAETFQEADRVMTPLLGKPLSDYIFSEIDGPDKLAEAEQHLKQTEITQPAVLSANIAIFRLLQNFGIEADMAMGHSLGEYGALVAAGMLDFAHALEAVSARGAEMAKVSVKDNGLMAAVLGPLNEIEKIVKTLKGYVVIANINSTKQVVLGGETKAVEDAIKTFQDAGFNIQKIPVSHAFHTKIVAAASERLAVVLSRMNMQLPKIPVISNVSGEFYPNGGNPAILPELIDMLAKQVASPVQFVKGLKTLYNAGARVFVEVGPKRVLTGFVEDVLGNNGEDIVTLFSNKPKINELESFNRTLCGLYAAGHGKTRQAIASGHKAEIQNQTVAEHQAKPAAFQIPQYLKEDVPQNASESPVTFSNTITGSADRFQQLGKLFADFLDKGMQVYKGSEAPLIQEQIGITGAAIGLPGTQKVFDDKNIERILNGEQFIKLIPEKLRQEMASKQVTRLVKTENGGPRFEMIDHRKDVIKLAARPNEFHLVRDFGFPEDRIPALDRVSALAIGAGIDALRDAGIPLVMKYKTTSKGTQLPDRWMLPDELKDNTGVIFASAFPGLDSYTADMKGYYEQRNKKNALAELEELRIKASQINGSNPLLKDIDERISRIKKELEENPFTFDRRFLFRVLSMGHSQFAEYIGARGPNTQVNAACASTTQAISLANDWIKMGRCRKVVVISADDITTENLLPWFGSGFLATGAAATDEHVEDAAIPFDRRRHGMIIGMGGAALVVESNSSAAERGLAPICDLLSSVTANSAFHGTRLDVDHIRFVMEDLVSSAEKSWGINRKEIAQHTVFISHETYTPARGGSAAAEINALRYVFGENADSIVISNTKGLTGHAMGTGIEDVIAVKSIETGYVPEVANFKEVDPELGNLNLSKGGEYPVYYALRLAAGFGSQISMSLLRWTPSPDGRRHKPSELGFEYRIFDKNAYKNWLKKLSGFDEAEVEVEKRTLRIKDQGPAAKYSKPVSEPVAQPVAAAEKQVVAETEKTETITQQAAVEKTSVANEVEEKVMQLVSEKTGYPRDMLDLDLDLEADLGIDTVKQAEMFAAIRENWNIERDDNMKLRDFPTLRHTMQFVYDHRPDLVNKTVSKTEGPEESKTEPSIQSANDGVVEKVLDLVSEKTGYPKDMLDPDLDLEADLGIDTVKQAEMFAAIREKWNIERDDNLQLRDFPTLKHTIQFVYDHRPDLKEAAQAATTPATEASASAVETETNVLTASDAVQEKVLQLVSEKTGYPRDMLDLDLDLEADLGIDTVKQAEMFASVREAYEIPRDDNLQLREFNTLASVIQFVYDRRPDIKKEVITTAKPQKETAALEQKTIAAESPPTAAQPSNEIVEKVLDLVSEKTGYPKDMLDLDLDLEADLGIDTVKQAEMFASVREAYDIPRDDNLQLREFNTLQAVIQFVLDRRPDLTPSREIKVEQKPKEADKQSGTDPVQQKVLELVTEKTGYPEDMLDLDLDLEADLGIDTVKQAEMFAAIRENWNIERDDNLQLREYNTLSRVIEFVYERAKDLEKPAGEKVGDASKVEEVVTPDLASSIKGDMIAANAIPRRIPTPKLRPQLDMCISTGVTLGKGDRVAVMADKGGVGKSLVNILKAKSINVAELDSSSSAEDLEKQLNQLNSEKPIKGVYWLAALDSEADFSKMDFKTWREENRIRIKLLYTTMRTLYDSNPFLVSATRLGGHFGYDDNGAVAPLGGAVCGFTKAYKREKSDVLSKVIDFETSKKTKALAEIILDETLYDPGAVEIGYKYDHRWTIGLEEKSLAQDKKVIKLTKDSVFVVTGAAGSIVSAIISDLAENSAGTFYLLDLAEKPDPNNPDIQRFISDKENLKLDIFNRLKESGQRATPAMVEKELAKIERMQSALVAVQEIEKAGGQANYYSVNLLDNKAVGNVVKDIRKKHKKIDVLIHAGGLEISRSLPDKNPQEFDLIYDVKADGWYNLISHIADLPLGAAVVFSSIAGRFGNAGQTDYSSANDLLCKSISSFKHNRKDTLGIAIDWTAWGDIGMAARGSIPTIMKQAGIDMLPAAAGIPIVRREITNGTETTEIVVAQRLGIMMNEFVENGGLDKDKIKLGKEKQGIMLGNIQSMGLYSGLKVETTLDPKKQPFLYDHQINKTPVLPGVMGLEALTQAAQILFPDLHVTAIENVNFSAPFKFYKNEPRMVVVTADFYKDSKGVRARCRLIGERKLHGQDEAQVTTHFTADILMEKNRPKALKAKFSGNGKSKLVKENEIYELYFHGPAYQVVEKAWSSNKKVYGLMKKKLPANHNPEKLPSLVMPRLIELCFQTAGLWEMGTKARMGLPYQIKQVHIVKPTNGKEVNLQAIVEPVNDEAFNALVVDDKGDVYLKLVGYKTSALPEAIDENKLKPLQNAMN